eukprot:GILK01002502.1.p1 GENE.GILK01002502.1~~GILK01002502.1.p1  ORF type:complete len:317 (+),score=43.07 GILK01002502.1:62-1012(+)
MLSSLRKPTQQLAARHFATTTRFPGFVKDKPYVPHPYFDVRFRRVYQGGVKAVILDWSGTVLDCGVYGPVVVFVEVFKRHGIDITNDEARAPMGTHKKVHIRKITELESVRAKWRARHGRDVTETDVEAMFKAFVPMQLAVLKDYSTMIPGAIDTVRHLQKDKGIKIGCSTGFTRAMLDIVGKEAAKAGYHPDFTVAADEVPQARPYPYMVWANALALDINPVESIVKVDDTVDGVKEGTSAGCWSIGLAKTGNYMGLNEAEIDALSEEDYNRRLKDSYGKLAAAGANYVIDDINGLPGVIEEINRRLRAGDRPWN